MQIAEILKATRGKLLSGNPDIDIDLAAISTDSRTIKQGEFFLPLKGNNYDGEKFIDKAFTKGAIGTFTTHDAVRTTHDGLIVIRVKDTTKALQQIAHAHRMKFRISVIGITGSNGKTTVKDMIADVLSSKYNVLKNEGTKNNHIGVPQTLLKLNEAHGVCVLEMGTNHKGEIRLLADIARPGIALITNIGPSHLEFFGSLKGVFEAKKEIFEFFNKDSLAILNGDDIYLSRIKAENFRITRFGFNNINNFRASRIVSEENRIKFFMNDKLPFVLNMVGAHNVHNALAAIAVAHHFKLDYEHINRRLTQFVPTGMRLNVKNIDGLVVINDAYNSNPLSMKRAIETVRSYPARARWIVSADMLELGTNEGDFHKIVGKMIANAGLDGLITFGNLSRQTSFSALEHGMLKDRVWHCSTREEAAGILRKVAKAGDVVLVKGSRAMRMEEVVEKLEGHRVAGP